MKTWKLIAAFILATALAGSAFAQASSPYGPPIMLAQQRVVVVRGPAQVQPMPVRQRRFVMAPAGAYPPGTQPRVVVPGRTAKTVRMSPEDRRVLRRQINEANQGIYHRQGVQVRPKP